MAEDDTTKPGDSIGLDGPADEASGQTSEHARTNESRRRLVIAGACTLLVVLVISNVLLWASLSSTKSDLKVAEAKVNRLDSAAGSAFQQVADRVGILEEQVGDVGSGSEDVSARVDDVQFALDDLYSCVNAFLEGFDRANGGFFTYQFC